MIKRFLSLILLIIFFVLSEQCKIHLRIFSKTEHPFLLQVIVPALKKTTEKLEFTAKEDYQIVSVEGEKCNGEHWIIKTWKKKDNEWIPAREIKTKLDSLDGWITVVVEDDYRPSFRDRLGILCSEGVCA